MLINQQSEQLETLKKIVRGTEQFRLVEAEGKLLRVPTGDGGALVFRNTPEAPVRCAVEISKSSETFAGRISHLVSQLDDKAFRVIE